MPDAPQTGTPLSVWDDALLAARLIANDPVRLGGVHVRARCGPVLDAWLGALRGMLRASATGVTSATGITIEPGAPAIRFPAPSPADRLVGGMDIGATLECGRPVLSPGVLAAADGGILILTMAERTPATSAAIIGAALDDRSIRIETNGLSRRVKTRLAVIALDEGAEPDETIPAALGERLGMRLDLHSVSWREALDTPSDLPVGAPLLDPSEVAIPDAIRTALTAAGAATGSPSLRLPIFMERVGQGLAALEGRKNVSEADAMTAIRLVLGAPLAQQQPEESAGEEDAPPPQDPPPTDDLLTDPPPDAPADPGETPPLGPDDLQDLAIAAASAARPEIFKHEARQDRQRGALTSPGKSGTLKDKARRGRPIGHTPSPPFPDARPDALATLHAAAPWQKLRRGTLPTESNAGEAQRAPLAIRKSDFRFTRFKQHTESVAIFVVDASGSTALQRLGEAKGAIELLLSECYVRRDQVALVTFRGDAASLALGPTRSLVRAKRTIGGLPGGGATPLASALSEAYQLAEQARRAGQSPLVVLMTDGNGNVALDGSRDRSGALEDTKRMARHFVASGLDAIIIDIGRRPREAARALANDLHADYCTLPRVDAASVSSLVSHYLQAS